jgi:predicted transcriptional regulator of viral defense system
VRGAHGGTICVVSQEVLHSEGFLVSRCDPAVAELAERQHGVVSTAQLYAAGVAQGAVELRVRRGRLHQVHRGVYAVGQSRLTQRGRMWAAVLACGGADAAVLSHRTAAAAWDLRPLPAGKLDVTSLRRSTSTGKLRVHRGQRLDPLDDVVRQPDGLPVTSVARTLVDLAGVLTAQQLERSCHRAEVLRRLDVSEVERLLASARRRGAGALRAALATLAPAAPDITRSELEERLLALVAGAGLPRPEVNAVVAGHEVDFLWRRQRLVVETDGAATHLTPTAFEEDRRRDAALQVAGFRVVRFTWRQITDDSCRVVDVVCALL